MVEPVKVSKDKRESKIAALLRERAGLEHGPKDTKEDREDKLAQVDEQLKAYGYKRDVKETDDARKTPPQERTSEKPRETVARPDARKP